MLLKKIKILVVDDDLIFLRYMRDLFEEEAKDYQIITATSGEEALQVFRDIQPFLGLLDINLPDMDGYSLCKHIRGFSTVPIIMITAKKDEADKLAGFEAGADDYITKPFSPFELIARVRAVLTQIMHGLASNEANKISPFR